MKKLFPCPCHDIPGTERWLETMAAKGLILRSVRFGLADFEREAPQALRYRVLPAPHEEEVIHEPEGWHYIASRSGDLDYQIFAASDPSAPEPERNEPDLSRTLKRNTSLFGLMAILVVSMVYDDFGQWPLAGYVLALDIALASLLLSRACSLFLLNQTHTGKRGKLSAPAHRASQLLMLLTVLAAIACAVLYVLGRG